MKKLALFQANNRSLLRELVITDFKLRYQGSVLGYLWSLLKPMMLFGVLYVVFTKIFKLGTEIPHYPTYLLLGLVLWIFFVEATNMGMGSIVARGDLVRKVSIPRYIIVLSTTFSAFVNLVFNLLVVGIFMAITHVPLQPGIVFLPIVLIELIVLAMGVSFLLSALYVKYRDMTHIWEVVLQMGFYATPILYPLSFVPHRMAQLISLSPLAQIIQDARKVTITSATITSQDVLHRGIGWVVPPLIVIGIVVVATRYFKRTSKGFAEIL